VTSEHDRLAEFVEAYRRHRIIEQIAWHERRSRQYLSARRWTTTVSAILLGASATCGALSAADVPRRALWAVLATVLAATAAAVTGYEAAFAFQRLSQQYAATAIILRNLDATRPTPEDLAEPDGVQRVQSFVDAVERALSSDVVSWSTVLRQS
jgi:hypothetical protein